MSVRLFTSASWLSRLPAPRRPGAEAASYSRVAGRSQPAHLVIAASVFLIVAIVVAVAMLLSDLRRDEIVNSKRDIESRTLLLADQIDRSFQSIGLIQDGLIDRIKSRGVTSTSDLARQMSGYDTYERLKDQIKALPFIDAIVLSGVDGRLINFSRRWPIPPIHNASPARDRVFKNSNVTSFVGDAVHSPENGEWVLPLSRKISSENGDFLGAALGVMRLQYFERLFETVAREGDRSISLFTGDGVLVARYPHDDALRGKSFAHRAVFTELLSQGRHGTVEQTSVTSDKSLLISGRNLPNHSLSIVITRRLDDVLAGWRYAALYVGAAAFIIALMIGGAAFLVIRQITRSMRAEHNRLDAALNNMSQGLSMFDASARLVVCNARYIEMFNMPHDRVKPGVSLQELIGIRIASGTFTKGAIAEPEDFVCDLQTQAKTGVRTDFTHELTDGRVIAVVNYPLPDGGWVATHDDITEARRREESFRLLFDRSPVPMWVFDQENLLFLAVNDAAIALYGYTREQFMAMTVEQLRRPEERDRFRRFLHSLPDSQFGENIGQHVASDGTILDVSFYSRTLTYSGHKARLTAVYDITKAKRAEEKLRRAEKFLDTIVENVPVPIVVKEVSGAVKDASECRYTLVNRAFEELFGASRTSIIGKTVAELYPKERADFIIAENNEALRSQQPIVLSDHAVHTPGNGIRITTAKSVAIRDDFDNPQYLVTVLQDVPIANVRNNALRAWRTMTI
jgi:PAS domain S-box-containing protein